MQRLKALTFKEKYTLLKNTFDEYQRAKAKLYCLENNNFYPEISYHVVREGGQKYNANQMTSLLNARIDDKEELQNIIKSFEYVISLLSEDSKHIIKHEFLCQKNRDWWLEYYSKSTYYRLKTRAMEEMLFYFNVF